MNVFHSWWDHRIRLYSWIGFCGEGTNIAKKLELATHDNLDWLEFCYRERVTHLSRQAKDLSVQHVDHKQDKAEYSQSKLGNKSVTWIKHKKVKFKATHGNLMNLLDLAKSNRVDN
jgi:hypothetical protein